MTDADATKRPVYPTPWRLEETPMTFHVRDVNGCSVVCGVGRLAGEAIVGNANRVPALVAQRDALLERLNALTDDDECSHDHHGNCQTHDLSNPCNVMLARKLIAEVVSALAPAAALEKTNAR